MNYIQSSFCSLLFLLFVFSVSAQNTVSPYSMFGPGEIQPRGFGRSQAMGGAGITLKSDSHLNNVNPASYAWMDTFRIISEIGVQGKYYDLSTNTENQSGVNGNLNYLALGFRYTGWMAGSFGLVPFSTIGYTVKRENSLEGTNAKYNSVFKGSGGVSQIYFSNAFKIGKHLSLGVNSSYLFGPLTQEENIVQTELVPQIQIVRQDFLKSFYFDFGLQYSVKFKKTEFSAGAVYSPRQNLESMHIINVYDASYTLIRGETYDTDYLIMPESYGFGLGIRKTDRLQVLLDYNFQKWSDAEYPNQKDQFEDLHRVSLGSEFKPWEPRVMNRWYQNWTYRVGVNYQMSYLKIGNELIDDKSISLGAGVPLPGKISNFDWSIRVGQNGTKAGGLVRENYVLFQMGFSLNEFAFIKRKFD